LISKELAVKALATIVSVQNPTRVLSFTEMLDGIKALAASRAIERDLAISLITRLSEYEITGERAGKTSLTAKNEHLFGRGERYVEIKDALENGFHTVPTIANYISSKRGFDYDDCYPRIYSGLMDLVSKTGKVIRKPNGEYHLSDDNGKSAIVPGKYTKP
jgi:hypothetical protein